jgi:hypothetical protein
LRETGNDLTKGDEMKVLIVGCGAIGQVFGYHLEQAGVEVGFFELPEKGKRLNEELRNGGINLFQISHSHRRSPIAQRLEKCQIMIEVEACKNFKPDQIWLTIPSQVYYSEWFRDFLGEVASERVVCFAPEGGRAEFFREKGDEERLVFGGITFIAWQGDLGGGGGRAEGVNYWMTPFTEIPLMGSKKGCQEAAEVLKSGGIRSAVKNEGFKKMQAAVTGILTAFVAGLELSGWSLRKFRASPWLKRAARASREAALSQLPGAGFFTKMLLNLVLTSVGLSIVTLFLPLFVPFDIEKYLKFHYLKTREQSLNLLKIFASDGEKQELATDNLRSLLQGLLEPS